jgi:tRNA A-37 threonylcarbamoyl transferase component Bud32
MAVDAGSEAGLRTDVTSPAAALVDGRYRVGAVIGRGAMGEVRSAWDERLDREVAYKCLRSDLARDPAVRARFEDEARSAARLAHHAIVTVFDSGEHDGVPYLVMERLPGRTLADELTDGPLPERRVEAIAVDIGGALATAHDLGVIHRDVKPGNILLTADGGVKLADFGIAKSADAMDHTQTGMIIGSPSYLAPERLAGEPATARSDLYALGVVLYEALTGTKPFRGDTPVALAHAIHTTSPEPIRTRCPGTSDALAGVIDGCMARAPGDRPASASDVVATLRASATQELAAVDADAGGAETVPMAATGVMGPATEVFASSEPPLAPIDAAPDPLTGSVASTLWRDRTDGQRHLLVATVAILLLVGVAVAWPHRTSSARLPGDLITTTSTVATTTTTPTTLVVAVPAPRPAPAPAGPGKGEKEHKAGKGR